MAQLYNILNKKLGCCFFLFFLYVSLFIVNILCGIIYDDIYENKFRMRLENSTNLFHIKIHTSLSYYNNYYLFIFQHLFLVFLCGYSNSQCSTMYISLVGCCTHRQQPLNYIKTQCITQMSGSQPHVIIIVNHFLALTHNHFSSTISGLSTEGIKLIPLLASTNTC